MYYFIHIEEFGFRSKRYQKRLEELTAEIPNVSEEATNPIWTRRLESELSRRRRNDILIGKIYT